jgi:REP element-mobilizing transposase RayT
MPDEDASTPPHVQGHPGRLPRLDPVWYSGTALVIWTHTVRDRTTGWLDANFHSRFRELLTHACARHHLACPAYVLMPDHLHLVWLGISDDANQLRATKFLREHLASRLTPHSLQPQAHDHVLREEARTRGALASTCHYVFANPERAGLVPAWQAWPHPGAMIAGYPNLDPRDQDYWARFWRIHGKLTGSSPNPPP